MDEKRRRFEALAMPHLDAAYNLARWLTRGGAEADDIVQDAMLRAFRSFDGFRGDAVRPGCWRSCAIATARRWSRRNAMPPRRWEKMTTTKSPPTVPPRKPAPSRRGDEPEAGQGHRRLAGGIPRSGDPAGVGGNVLSRYRRRHRRAHRHGDVAAGAGAGAAAGKIDREAGMTCEQSLLVQAYLDGELDAAEALKAEAASGKLRRMPGPGGGSCRT